MVKLRNKHTGTLRRALPFFSALIMIAGLLSANIAAAATFTVYSPARYSTSASGVAITQSGYYHVEAFGGDGGTAAQKSGDRAPAGVGGTMRGLYWFDAGTTLYVQIGGKGADGAQAQGNDSAFRGTGGNGVGGLWFGSGGYGGHGGAGGYALGGGFAGGGGGGASGILVNGAGLNNIYLAAGGGGGSGAAGGGSSNSKSRGGGAGGGYPGENGYGYTDAIGGTGGHGYSTSSTAGANGQDGENAAPFQYGGGGAGGGGGGFDGANGGGGGGGDGGSNNGFDGGGGAGGAGGLNFIKGTVTKPSALNYSSNSRGAGRTSGEVIITYLGVEYTIALSDEGGSGGSGSTKAYYNENMRVVSVPSRAGYIFAGYWDATSGGTQYYNASGTYVRAWNKGQDTTLYARWTPITYSITYSGLEGATHSNPISYTTETSTITLTAPSQRSGWVFAGWFTTSEVGGEQVTQIQQGSLGNEVVYARWTLAPTIPSKINNDTLVVIPDPTTLGGIVLEGAIDATPSDPEQSQVFEADKVTVYTATNILGTWSLADQSGYTIVVAADGKSFSIVINPTADAARFYRVATTLQPVDASGAPVAGDTVKYNTTLFGRYEVTVPASQTRLVVNQLANGVSDAVALFSDLAVGSSINITKPDGTTASATKIAAGGGRWQPTTLVFPVGSVASVRNAGVVASTKEFVGVVPTQSVTYSLTGGETRKVGTSLPIAASTVALGISPVVGDAVATYRSNGSLVTNTYLAAGGGRWQEGNAPTTIHIGEGFQIKYNATLFWAPRLNVVEDSMNVGLE